jgi:TM2 domain-containing membrane protein YozV
MPIEVTCASCNRRLRVPDKTAGKKVKCPKCQGVIQVPDPVAAAAPAAADEAPAGERWYLKTDDGEDYGPVDRSELDQWASEGRLNADCQLLQEGAEQWQWATDLYPELDASAAAAEGGVAGYGAAGEDEVGDKKKFVAGLLGVLLGTVGAHRFYLGYTGIGIIQIVVTVFTCGMGGFWGIIEGILIFLGKFDRDAQGRRLIE